MQPVCKGCGQIIWGRYFNALGTTWHPEHFVCGGCGRPMNAVSFQVHEGQPYHAECYANLVAPRCAYCNRPLIGEYLVDHWGAHFCKEHQGNYPSCECCGRLIPPQQREETSGELVRCAICRGKAIETADAARPLFNTVKQWVASQGLVYNNLPLSLELCGKPRLSQLLRDHHLTHARGATVSATYSSNGRDYYSEVRGVAVLRGLPALLFQGITVHELGHVWLVVHGLQSKLPLWAEEGFCELLTYRFYQAHPSQEATYYARGIEENRDPVYGDGFRRVRAIAERSGFAHLLTSLRIEKRLPA